MSDDAATPRQQTSPRRLGPGELVTIALGVLAIVVLTGVPSAAEPALFALIVALVAWPAVLLSLLILHWLRRRDVRFALLGVLLIAVSVAGIAASMWLM